MKINKREVILADIGNTHFHIYINGDIIHLKHDVAIDRYGDKKLYYINVNQKLDALFEAIDMWVNISSKVHIDGQYSTMGVDRRALCLSRNDGVFVDAGSAITVDVVTKGVYTGGFILQGINSMLKSYGSISKTLNIALNKNILLDRLPTTTKDGISYGIIASIKALIEQESINKPLYITGGDGEFLSSYLDNAIYDDKLVFEGMSVVLKDIIVC